MAKTRFKSDALEAIHSVASGQHRATLIDQRTMREYDELCIEKAPKPDAEVIAHSLRLGSVNR